VPLGIVCPLHPRAELGGAPPVVPQLEIGKIDRLVERRVGQKLLLLELLHDGVALLYPTVDRVHQGIGVGVQRCNKLLVVAITAYVLHALPVALPGWTQVADGGK
jgi:hypothetical protein